MEKLQKRSNVHHNPRWTPMILLEFLSPFDVIIDN